MNWQKNNNCIEIFLKGKGDGYTIRYALQYLYNYMGVNVLDGYSLKNNAVNNKQIVVILDNTTEIRDSIYIFSTF